jgi:hypothetical protein
MHYVENITPGKKIRNCKVSNGNEEMKAHMYSGYPESGEA